MISRFQGDPRLVIGPDGSSLQFAGGQPLMDQGLENLAIISLFTAKGWCGNTFMKSDIGSDFEALCNQPLTKSSLVLIKNAATLALGDVAFGSVAVQVANPTGNNLNITIQIEPPGGNPQEVSLQRNGGNWLSQALNPASLQVIESLTGKAINTGSRTSMQDETGAVWTFETDSNMEF